MLELERQLVQEKEMQLRKQEKPPPERESVQLVKNLEEKQKEDLGDDNSPLFLLHLIRTVNGSKIRPKKVPSPSRSDLRKINFNKIGIKNYNKSCKLYQKLHSTEGADIKS